VKGTKDKLWMGRIRIVLPLLFYMFYSSMVDAQTVKRVITTYNVKSFSGINDADFQFSPWVLGENRVIYVSDHEYDILNEGENNWRKKKRLNLFAADVVKWNLDTLILDNEKLFNQSFLSNSHVGPSSLNQDGNFIAFNMIHVGKMPKNWQTETGRESSRKKLKQYKPQIYFSDLSGSTWSKPKPYQHNNPEYSLGHPALSLKGDVMVFASDMPGGKGGKDLFISYLKNGSWTEPAVVIQANTSSDEVFPCISDSVLYFSSNRSGGSGNLDLYKVALFDKNATPVHLGDTLNSAGDDFGISFFPGRQVGLFSSNREGTAGNDDLFFFEVIETAIVESRELAGEFRYRSLGGKKAANMKVELYDDEGNLLLETETDENGRFNFRNLSFDDKYTLKLKNAEDDMELVIFNSAGDEIAYMLSNENGEFVYKRLNAAEVGTLSLIDTEDIDPTLNQADLSGQFVYEHLKAKYPSGLKVILVDEEGNVVQETVTDENGNFTFRNLNMSKNYLIRTEQVDDLTLLIYNKDNQVTAMLRMGDDGMYTYRKLKQQYKNNLLMIDLQDSLMLEDITSTVAGQFTYRTLKKNFGEGVTFEVYDDKGTLLMNAVCDKDGYFRLKNLPLAESYLLKIPGDESELNDMELNILSRYGKKIAMLHRDSNGYFVYSPLGLVGGVTIVTNDNNDQTQVVFQNKEIPILYFDKNSSVLTADAKTVLAGLVERLKSNPELKIEVSSYADSRATAEYNIWLSDRRTKMVVNYLLSKGIQAKRISGNAYGESNLVNRCDDNVECPDELHRLNRRTEFRIY
jgi:flagellar motor protein MotB